MSRAQLTSTVEQNTGGAVSPYVAGKNKIINGDFGVWQRGTSISVAASTNAYTADRWFISTATSQACTVSRQPTNDTTNLPFIQYCARVQRNSGQTGTGGLGFWQNMETVNSIPFAGKVATASFYARAGANFSASGNNLTVIGAISGTGTDQNLASGYTGQVNGGVTTATLTTTWQRFTVTATIPTNATELTFYTTYSPTGTAGANDYFEITGVQLEAGSVATPFTTATGTIQGELAACQRYYWRASVGAYNYLPGTGSGNTTTSVLMAFPLHQTMRVSPTSVDFSAICFWDGVAQSAVATSAGIQSGNADTVIIYFGVTSGITVYRPYLILTNATGYIGLNAEL